ncbi:MULTISPECIES: rhamnulokinase family protein [unclassified Frondihabitans]|uniref:rhamnulokinase n=1 Tax=unclassified Frondihabitans TaxID=2626248 RepID=UPI000F4D3797|nr:MULTISPECIES: rhamnulokinase family protein [unclassified Frondihabitans]RPE77827.1 rhamnulokinase [Frondihabitans sp. PhB153]RPF08106.1 rhamnulokinase [Frondihabitans sp. PhB161]
MRGNTAGAVAAVDLGATSGRVILGHVGPNELRLQHVARFANRPVGVPEGEGREGLHWDVLGLWQAIRDGLTQATRLHSGVASIGVDSWAVDYGLLRNGRLVGLPYHYRDARNAASVNAVHAAVPATALYERNGLAHLPFNTIYQLAADRAAGTLALADRALLVPDLIGRWLTGVEVTERTNASTTGLLSPKTGRWDPDLFSVLGLQESFFAPLVSPGDRVGALLPSFAGSIGNGREIPVTAVGSHDTASAVVGVPLVDEHAAFISSGTWSLVGLELDAPVVTDASRAANFTNEGGAFGRVRFLKNISGLWLLSESMRTWDAASTEAVRSSDLASLLSAAAAIDNPVPIFDAADERFSPPGDMPGRIRDWCLERDVRPPLSPAETVRSILESLAVAYAETLDEAEVLSGRQITTVHVVGGGSQNELLCQLTADRTGRTVLAGPVEATAIGNVLVQARATGLVSGASSLESLRALVRATYPPIRYEPSVPRSFRH